MPSRKIFHEINIRGKCSIILLLMLILMRCEKGLPKQSIYPHAVCAQYGHLETQLICSYFFRILSNSFKFFHVALIGNHMICYSLISGRENISRNNCHYGFRLRFCRDLLKFRDTYFKHMSVLVNQYETT